ncbi:MAG: hypothetical protein AAFU80_07635 [Pseudomonadota bacterium]
MAKDIKSVDWQAHERREALTTEIQDCQSIARLLSNELSRDRWLSADEDVEALRLLVREISEHIGRVRHIANL